MRRWIKWSLFVGFLALALVGSLVFIAGLLAGAFTGHINAEDPGAMPVFLQLSLAGLCLAALMFFLWLTLVGIMLVRQSRAQGAGYGDAYRLIEAFRFGEAIPLLERAVRDGKETSDVLMLLTSAYAYTGQLAKAQRTADRSVQLFPNDPNAYITLANGYRLQAAYAEAAQALMEAVELTPDQPALWAELGFLQHFAGDKTDAVESLKRAATHAMPAMYGVRVYYHLTQAYLAEGDMKNAVKATAKMMSARDGLEAWKTGMRALEGTAYGQALRYEVLAIEQALADADAGNLG
jgi:tetratricopeptide (TPR) repeat protein